VKQPARVLALVVALVLAVSGAALSTPQPAAAAPQQPLAGSRWGFVGDISRPTNETEGFDEGTAELLVKLQVNWLGLLGDVQYETGSEAMFRSPVGFDGTYGRLLLNKIAAPAVGNHDVTDPGAGAPGFNSYFSQQLTGLPCQSDPTPCHPEQGWYGLDLDANSDGQPDWYVVVVNNNCGRPFNGTGDPETPSCANDSPMVNWMRAYMGARHGGCCSGRKASILIGHQEPFGSCFFADDRRPDGTLYEAYILQVWQHFHGDVALWGHTHSTGRLGPMTWDGHLTSGAGSRHIASGAGGRSLTPCRVSPLREGTRYRNDTKYGVEVMNLTVSKDPAGWTGGTWSHEFFYTDGTRADAAAAGIWP
jgi:hypothetical protein